MSRMVIGVSPTSLCDSILSLLANAGEVIRLSTFCACFTAGRTGRAASFVCSTTIFTITRLGLLASCKPAFDFLFRGAVEREDFFGLLGH